MGCLASALHCAQQRKERESSPWNIQGTHPQRWRPKTRRWRSTRRSWSRRQDLRRGRKRRTDVFLNSSRGGVVVFLLAPQYSCSLNSMFEETLRVYILEESLLVVMLKFYCLPCHSEQPP